MIDAVRTHERAKVVIKSVDTRKNELSLLRLLNSPELRADPRNNVVEVLDIMLAPDTDDKVFVVMPKLMIFAVIPFQDVGEVLDAFSQFLEVYCASNMSFPYLIRAMIVSRAYHSSMNMTSHTCESLSKTLYRFHAYLYRDVCFYNLMIDATKLAPNGFHMTDSARTEHNITKYIRYKTRREVGSIRYVIIDVGISEQFRPREQPRCYGSWGQDRTILEFQSKGVAHDPYKTDVCQLGNVLKRLIQVRSIEL